MRGLLTSILTGTNQNKNHFWGNEENINLGYILESMKSFWLISVDMIMTFCVCLCEDWAIRDVVWSFEQSVSWDLFTCKVGFASPTIVGENRYRKHTITAQAAETSHRAHFPLHFYHCTLPSEELLPCMEKPYHLPNYPESSPSAQPHRTKAPQTTCPTKLTCTEESNCCCFCFRRPVWVFGFLGGRDFTLPLSRNLK